MRDLLNKGYSNLSLLLWEAPQTQRLRADKLSSDMAQIHFKNVAESLGGKDGNIKRR
jgi:hypothetical protein